MAYNSFSDEIIDDLESLLFNIEYVNLTLNLFIEKNRVHNNERLLLITTRDILNKSENTLNKIFHKYDCFKCINN